MKHILFLILILNLIWVPIGSSFNNLQAIAKGDPDGKSGIISGY